MVMNIRQARVEDSDGIAAILRAIGWSEQMQHETVSETQGHIEARLLQALREQTHSVFVAEQGEGREIAGYVAVHWYPHLLRGNDGYVSELFVHPAMAGQEIGSRLLEVVREDGLRRGCTRLLLMNRRDRESYKRGFYAKRGWKEMDNAAFFSLALESEE
jgi:N-acetylglutamate synthase-like GNAT family acetyltransferase